MMGIGARTKWLVLVFLCAIFIIYTIDRALLGLLAIPIQKEMGLSDVRMGVLNSAIFWTYAVFAPLSGLVGDRLNRARLIGVASMLWSLMALLAGLGGGFWHLLMLASFAMVVPQTAYAPAATALIASLHRETRTLAMSIHQAAFYVGWFVSGAAVAMILSMWGTWRAAFLVFGAFGMAFGIAFLAFARSSACGQHSSAAKPPLKESFRAFFGCRSALLAGTGYVAVVFVGCGYCAWGPKFVASKFNVSAAMAGAGVMFWHYAASFLAILLAGMVTDKLVGRFPRIRLLMSISAMSVSIPALLLFAVGGTLTQTLTGAGLLGAAFGVCCANQFTNLFDVIRPDFRSACIGFLNVIAGLVGSLAPLLLGWLSQTRGTHGLECGFASIAALMAMPIAAFAVSFFFTFSKERISE